ncbi:hypothetical protein LC593_34355 [Nostoc sp. CHAB 5844]|nr:hypothetical protein [Nostoc sp. CHAB 5844]
MTKQIEVYDFIRPKIAPANSVWRVLEIKGNRITAQRQYSELETKQVERVSGTPDFFDLLDENNEDDD